MKILDENINDIRRLCTKHKVKNLFAFGSVITEQFNSESDIDLVVDFEPIEVSTYADNYFDLKFSLQDIFKRPVDLLEVQAIKNPYFKKSLDQNKKIIYAS